MKKLICVLVAILNICVILCGCNSSKELKLKEEVINFFEMDKNIQEETIDFLKIAKEKSKEIESDEERKAYCQEIVGNFEEWEKDIEPYEAKFNEKYKNETDEKMKEDMKKYFAFNFPRMTNYHMAITDESESSLSLYVKVLREINYMAELFCGYEESWIPINF